MEQSVVGRLCFGELKPVFQPSPVLVWDLVALRSIFCFSAIPYGSTARCLAPLGQWVVLAGGWKVTKTFKSEDLFPFLSVLGIYLTMAVAPYTLVLPSIPPHRSTVIPCP